MAKNYIQSDDSKTLIAPVGGVIGGSVYKNGSHIGVVEGDAAEGEAFTLNLEGAYGSLPKKPAEAFTDGQKLYWDDVNHYLTATPGALEWAGYAYGDALAADVICSLMLKQ